MQERVETTLAVPSRLMPPLPVMGLETDPRVAVRIKQLSLDLGIRRFFPRTDIEDDEEWNQPVITVVVRSPDGKEVLKLTKSDKKKENGAYREQRIVGRQVVFASGHIEAEDMKPSGVPFMWGVSELHGELVIPGSYDPKFLGVVSDQTTHVGRVHTGLVHEIRVEDPSQVQIRDHNELVGMEWIPVAELGKHDELCSWSQAIGRRLQQSLDGTNIYLQHRGFPLPRVLDHQDDRYLSRLRARAQEARR